MVVKSLHMHTQWFCKTAEALCSPNGSFVRHIAIISLSFPSLLSTFPCSGKALCVGGTHAQAHDSTHDFLAYLTRYHPSNFTMKTPPRSSCTVKKAPHNTKPRIKSCENWTVSFHKISCNSTFFSTPFPLKNRSTVAICDNGEWKSVEHLQNCFCVHKKSQSFGDSHLMWLQVSTQPNR